jgi:hypothetical protein
MRRVESMRWSCYGRLQRAWLLGRYTLTLLWLPRAPRYVTFSHGGFAVSVRGHVLALHRRRTVVELQVPPLGASFLER